MSGFEQGLIFALAGFLAITVPFILAYWAISAFIKKKLYAIMGSVIAEICFFCIWWLIVDFKISMLDPFPIIYFWATIIIGIIPRLMPKLKAFIHKVKGGANK